MFFLIFLLILIWAENRRRPKCLDVSGCFFLNIPGAISGAIRYNTYIFRNFSGLVHSVQGYICKLYIIDFFFKCSFYLVGNLLRLVSSYLSILFNKKKKLSCNSSSCICLWKTTWATIYFSLKYHKRFFLFFYFIVQK